jgi:hypothetical protein
MKKKRLTLLLLFFAIALAAVGPVVIHADDLIKATLTVEGDGFNVGDPVQLTLAVTHPAEHYVILPELESEWGDLIVHSQSPATTVNNDDGTKTTTQVIDVRLFAPGTYATPPLAITVSDGAGGLSEVLVTPIDVTISSVLVEGDNELRDIKPQAELPFTNVMLILVGGFLVVMAIGGAALVWWRRRRTRMALTVDNRAPHEVALDELVRIAELRLPDQGRFKKHYTLTADCIRTYVERTYHVPVLERTTAEVQASLKQTTVEYDVARQFISFLNESDMVKFSKFAPDIPTAYRLLAAGIEIVELTKPVPTPSESDGAEIADGTVEETEHNIPSGPQVTARRANQRSEVTL